jgi:PAS domain S-box-containing protein
MKRRILFGLGVFLLLVCVVLVVWQGSFSFGDYGPEGPGQVWLIWAVSTLVFLLTVTLGFMLFRIGLKLYIERRTNREGSRIRTKLVVGALLLSFLPVVFLVLFSISVLNRNLDKWFSRPAQDVRLNLKEIGDSLNHEMERRVEAEARALAATSEVSAMLGGGEIRPGMLTAVCKARSLNVVYLELPGRGQFALCSLDAPKEEESITFRQALSGNATLVVTARRPLDLAAREREISRSIAQYDQLARHRKEVRNLYLLMLVLISLFILFFATWTAQMLARQISVPIAALLGAAQELRKGNLATRVHVRAIDEMATLVRAFNEMTMALEANDKELERRRRFTEAILDNIPTGVISLAADGRILKINPALKQIFPGDEAALWLGDLFPREEAEEVRYLMKRARRLGVASRQFELARGDRNLHLAVTVSALDDRQNSGFVMVIEDTSELLRAQKAAAWHEVARRIAHEIKNPLTPIALCAQRIARHLERAQPAPDSRRILGECAETIVQEVESVRTLVDEFSQFARFPAAQLRSSDLNEVVENALAAFTGRLDTIRVDKRLQPGLPPVEIDPELFKRVVVNLVDNAAEAMHDAPVKQLLVATCATSPEAVELVVADTGPGVSQSDKEKLFLPYFSTKGRGTGLGLAIVSHILAEHKASIRVEDNRPSGARFIVELPVPVPEPEPARVEVR